MKITIECTPSDAADALLHLLDGGAAGGENAPQKPDDTGGVVIYRDRLGIYGVTVDGKVLPPDRLTSVDVDCLGDRNFLVSVTYETKSVREVGISGIAYAKGGDA